VDPEEWDDSEFRCAVHPHVRLQVSPDGDEYYCSACWMGFSADLLPVFAQDVAVSTRRPGMTAWDA
jgi:hypothetical protein